MEFFIDKSILQRELTFIQGVLEKRNALPALSHILIETTGEREIRLTGTDLDLTIRCSAEVIQTIAPGAACVPGRKLFDVVRLLSDERVHFCTEERDRMLVKCGSYQTRIAGVSRAQFPDVPVFKAAPLKIPAAAFKGMIDRTIYAITQEESRYTLSGGKFVFDKSGALMVTTDGHRLSFVLLSSAGERVNGTTIDTLIPRKALSEVVKLAAAFEGEIGLGTDDNHIYFEVGTRLLISRKLSGQFPDYEMVMPKANDKSVILDANLFNQVLRRVSLMADDRSHAVRLRFLSGRLEISSQSAEEGEATESLPVEYAGEEAEIGFNASYLQDVLAVSAGSQVAFEFKDGNTQILIRPVADQGFDFRGVVMPMRL